MAPGRPAARAVAFDRAGGAWGTSDRPTNTFNGAAVPTATMRATRRAWTVGAVGALLAGAAVAFAQPWLLAGAGVVGAWLLAAQVAFVRQVTRLDSGLTVDVQLTPGRVATDEPVDATLTVDIAAPSACEVSVTLEPPVAVQAGGAAERTVRLHPGETEAATTATVTAPVAGLVRFRTPTVTVEDDRGFFTATLRRGPTPSVTVDPRAPRNVHVGQGGEEIAVAYGEHDAGRLGSGLEPAELREYLPGDAASRIDWKATARLNHPHVREFEAETDRTTVLVVDHRSSMGLGREGEGMLDYAREVALAFLASARDLDDPLGVFTVGEEGLTERLEPAATAEQYHRVRTVLTDLGLTERTDGRGPAGRSPAAARRDAQALDGPSAFDRTLRPFLAGTAPYVERVAEDPLFGAVSTDVTRLRGSVWTVVFTDDTHRTELREAVKVARRGDDHVLVFITPAVLYDRDGLADLETAYDRYADFESYRRELDRLDRVTAFEVSPGDRLHAVLEARRERRRVPGGGG